MMFLYAFLGITALTAVVVLLANIGVFGEAVRTSEFAKWGITAVIAEIVTATVAAFKWWLPSFDAKISLDFSPQNPFDIDLDQDNCTYELREAGKIIETGKIDLALSHANWQCALPSSVKPKQVVKLNLAERNGKKWEVRPFYPFDITQKAYER